ncbi:MAG: DUF4349 domain-containing protein [Lachnospiraceae bacterium]|nr:DUF4349 domain-containing protein [Lachnospiraceae bacterium]
MKKNSVKTKLFQKPEKRFSMCLTGLLLTAAMLTGCGGSSTSMYSEMAYDTGGYGEADKAATTEEVALSVGAGEAGGYENAFPEENTAAQESASETAPEENPSEGRKLIKTVDLYVETEQYDKLLVNLEAQIAALGGYVEYQYQYNGSSYSNYDETRNAHLSVRIPAARLDEFIQKVDEQSNITNKEERVEDVTLQYVDLESRKKALVIEQDRLLELLEKAETVEDIITIEQRLSEVRYELENMESKLRILTNQIDYSTININIEEVRRLTPTEEKSAWDRMKNGFVKSIYRIGDNMESGFIGFVINLPYYIVWLFVIGIVFFVVRAVLKRRKRKRTEKEQKEENSDQNGEREQ